jgi:ribose transport system substrate-binding protein
MKNVINKLGLYLLLTCFLFINGCAKNVNLINGDKKNIVLITKMNNGYYWGSVKQGAETAGREFNVNVNFMAPEDEEDVRGQIELVNQELDGEKMDALVLAASDYEGLKEVTEKVFDQHIPVIIIDSEVNTKKINSYIAMNNLEMGNQAGNELVSLVGRECKIAIVSFVKGTRNAEQREEGLLGFIRQHPGIHLVATEYCLSNSELAYELTKKIIAKHRDIDAIIALNAISSEGVAEAIDEMKLAGKVKIIAFDNTPKEIDYMDKGVIQATITQNPFSIGYMGIKYAFDALNGNSIPKYFDTGSKIIEGSNMYSPENQKILFPIVK